VGIALYSSTQSSEGKVAHLTMESLLCRVESHAVLLALLDIAEKVRTRMTVFNSTPYHEDISAIRNFCTKCKWSLHVPTSHGATALRRKGSSYYGGFTIIFRHTTVGRTLLDE
jgi:hypothetical protein